MRLTRRSFDALPVVRNAEMSEPQSLPGIRRARTGELQHLRSQVLEDRGRVHRGLGADPDVVLRALLQVTVDTTDGKLIKVVRPRLELKKVHALGGRPFDFSFGSTAAGLVHRRHWAHRQTLTFLQI